MFPKILAFLAPLAVDYASIVEYAVGMYPMEFDDPEEHDDPQEFADTAHRRVAGPAASSCTVRSTSSGWRGRAAAMGGGDHVSDGAGASVGAVHGQPLPPRP